MVDIDGQFRRVESGALVENHIASSIISEIVEIACRTGSTIKSNIFLFVLGFAVAVLYGGMMALSSPKISRFIEVVCRAGCAVKCNTFRFFLGCVVAVLCGGILALLERSAWLFR